MYKHRISLPGNLELIKWMYMICLKMRGEKGIDAVLEAHFRALR